jgi:RNA polymerase sigma-70 factor (ECF subfamily)
MDANFLKALRSGDVEAFNALVADNRDRVVGTCYRFLGNREDAEDTALDVFVEIHRSLPGFREEAQLSTWIYRIAVTKSLDILRRRKRKKRFAAFRSGPSAAEVEPESLPGAPDDDPGRAHELRERSRILEAKIDELPESQKAALRLARYEGLSAKEVAAVLGTSVPAVDALLHRAVKNLRKALSRYYTSDKAKEE